VSCSSLQFNPNSNITSNASKLRCKSGDQYFNAICVALYEGNWIKKIRGYANILLQKPSLLLKLNWSNPITKLIKNLLSNTFLQKWNNFEPTKYKEKIKFESIVCHYWLAYNIFSDPWPKQCNRSCSYFKSYGSPACCAYLGKGLTWTEAQSSCQALGGRLPEVYDALDNDRILAIRVLLLTYFFSFIILPNLT